MPKTPTKKERLHLKAVKEQPCIVCDRDPPSYAHHIVSGYRLGHEFTLALCYNCHQGDNGFSGKNRNAWDKSVFNQLKLLDLQCQRMGIETPVYQSKIPPRRVYAE